MSDEEPKIIIDEGWKSQVEREKQQALDANEETPAPDTEEITELGKNFTIFDSLISGLAAQTMVSLGLTGEEGQEVQVDLGYAHHLINTLLMLQEKTSGNLEEGEAANLAEAIGELQRIFSLREEQVTEMQQQSPTPAIDTNPHIIDNQ